MDKRLYELNVDGTVNSPATRPRAGARTREGRSAAESAAVFAATWTEACKATDEVLAHFGHPGDRGIWVWYCRRIGVDDFLEIFREILSLNRQGEIRFPIRAFHRRLQEWYRIQQGGAK